MLSPRRVDDEGSSLPTHPNVVSMQALDLLDRMEAAGLTANQVSYNTCLAACATQGLPDVAKSLLDRMIMLGITPTTLSYNSLINANANAETARVDEAMKCLELMAGTEVKPDDVSFSLIVKAYGNHGSATLALVHLCVTSALFSCSNVQA